MDIGSAASSIPAIINIFNKIFKGKESPDVVALKQHIFSLQQAFLIFQSKVNEAEISKLSLDRENLKLKEENSKLMKQISESDNWNKEQAKYEAHKLSTGTTVYRTKGTDEHFCPRCFVNDKIAIHLQTSIKLNQDNYVFCPKCSSDYFVKPYSRNQFTVVEPDEPIY